MKRCVILLLLAAMMLIALPAFADEAPIFSEDMQLLRTANDALYERYGLTMHCLGLFDTEINRYGSAATVRYIPHSRPHPSLSGEYLVVITGDSVSAYWTHDDVDPAVWQSGELNKTAWGAPQLIAYLEEDSFEREFFDAPYITEPTIPHQYFDGGHMLSTSRGTLSEEEAARPNALARQAVIDMYHLSDEEAAKLVIHETSLLQPMGETAEWLIGLYMRTEPDEINFRVTIDAETMLVTEMDWQTGGIG